MSWIDQGRQEHGWFGHGTSGAGPEPSPRGAAIRVAYGAIGFLPATQRRPYEGWLRSGGLEQVAGVLPGWVAGAGLSGAAFRDAFFDTPAVQYLAGHAQAVGQALAAEDDKAAGRSFAALVAAARPEGMARAMADAVRQVGTPEAQAAVQRAAARRGRSEPAARPAGPARGRTAGLPHAPGRPMSREAAARLRLLNITAMARVLYNEARQQGDAAMAAVGYTLRNRMQRNDVATVEGVWGGYAHATPNPTDSIENAAYARARGVAAGVIDGTIPDKTSGATHFYTPQRMSMETDFIKRGDIAGGLEDVAGTTDGRGQHVRNYRPGWSVDPRFERVLTPDFPERDFKFFVRRNDVAGRVR